MTPKRDTNEKSHQVPRSKPRVMTSSFSWETFTLQQRMTYHTRVGTQHEHHNNNKKRPLSYDDTPRSHATITRRFLHNKYNMFQQTNEQIYSGQPLANPDREKKKRNPLANTTTHHHTYTHHKHNDSPHATEDHNALGRLKLLTIGVPDRKPDSTDVCSRPTKGHMGHSMIRRGLADACPRRVFYVARAPLPIADWHNSRSA